MLYALRIKIGTRTTSAREPSHCSLLANEFDVRSVLHGKVSLAAVNQIYVIHEDMTLQKSIDSLKARFENVNI